MSKIKKEELKKAFENLDEGPKQHMSKLHELIDKEAMTPEQVEAMIKNVLSADKAYPELESIEEISGSDYASLYKKMSEEFKASPEKYEEHVRISGMSADELSLLFAQINGAIEKYPEVWESQEAAHLLSPKNLVMLIDAFKKEEKED